jgi:hypothetical protein
VESVPEKGESNVGSGGVFRCTWADRHGCLPFRISYVPLVAPSTSIGRVKFLASIADSFIYVVSKVSRKIDLFISFLGLLLIGWLCLTDGNHWIYSRR